MLMEALTSSDMGDIGSSTKSNSKMVLRPMKVKDDMNHFLTLSKNTRNVFNQQSTFHTKLS